MLWPWNCFLSAAAYFQERFKSSDFLRENFQSCMCGIEHGCPAENCANRTKV
jgi:hypothetical protein